MNISWDDGCLNYLCYVSRWCMFSDSKLEWMNGQGIQIGDGLNPRIFITPMYTPSENWTLNERNLFPTKTLSPTTNTAFNHFLPRDRLLKKLYSSATWQLLSFPVSLCCPTVPFRRPQEECDHHLTLHWYKLHYQATFPQLQKTRETMPNEAQSNLLHHDTQYWLLDDIRDPQHQVCSRDMPQLAQSLCFGENWWCRYSSTSSTLSPLARHSQTWWMTIIKAVVGEQVVPLSQGSVLLSNHREEFPHGILSTHAAPSQDLLNRVYRYGVSLLSVTV